MLECNPGAYARAGCPVASSNMRVHFIAIGGSAMHNIALAVQAAGHEVTGSDDQIFEPSRGRLRAAGLYQRQTVGIPMDWTIRLTLLFWACTPVKTIPNFKGSVARTRTSNRIQSFCDHATPTQHAWSSAVRMAKPPSPPCFCTPCVTSASKQTSWSARN